MNRPDKVFPKITPNFRQVSSEEARVLDGAPPGRQGGGEGEVRRLEAGVLRGGGRVQPPPDHVVQVAHHPARARRRQGQGLVVVGHTQYSHSQIYLTGYLFTNKYCIV